MPSADLLRGGLEMLTQSFVMVQLGIQERIVMLRISPGWSMRWPRASIA